MNCQTRPISIFLGYRSRNANSGAALVIVLAAVVILSGLVLAVLTHSMLETQISSTSANQTTASLFARGATDSVISELKQEITAGSSAYYPPTASDVRDPNCFFMPVTNQAMVPYRMDSEAPSNVIKRSAYNVPFYTGSYYNASWPAPNWAANLSTTNAGVNSRSISMARWNKPLLMPVSPSATDLTPTNTFVPPDWIYMTRTAGPATTWNPNLISPAMSNTNSVVGRYAYVVYDEGGLLDANAAGYPSSVSASMVRNKISEACADLTQIGLSSTDIDALATWRNPVNGASSTNYISYVYAPSTNAFLTPAAGERMFTSRQQLISFLTQNVANSAGDPAATARIQAALPYLTHFSRELNAPSWYPQTNAAPSGVYAYLNNSTNNPPSSTTVNIFAPLARAGSSYTDVSNLTVQKNQPVAFGRFPLSRLAWLGPTGAVAGNGESTANILQSFGLKWDASNFAWQYVGTAGTVQSTILPLSQITGREPNFFELLKAAILNGSAGVTPGQQVGLGPAGVDSRYTTSDEQIMQIGLDMIDQASPAALPIRIEFGANNGTAAGGAGDGYAAGDSKALYGNKNLPYLYRMVFSPYRPTTEQSDGSGVSQVFLDAWAEPVFWNPYQTPTTNTAPLQVRVRPDSADAHGLGQPAEFGSQTVASLNGTNTYLNCIPELPCGAAGYAPTLELDSTSGATLNSASTNPVLLATLVANPAFTLTINDSHAVNPWIGGPANADQFLDPGNGANYVGFWLGRTYAPNPPDTANNEFMSQFTTPVNFRTAIFYYGGTHNKTNHAWVLEANYGTAVSPNFLEVQRMTFEYTSGSYVEETDNFTKPQRRLNLFTLNDPRTSRFGFDVIQPNGYNRSDFTVTAVDTTSATNTVFPYPGPSSPGSGPTTNIIYAPVSSTAAPVLGGNSAGGNPIVVNTVRFADNSSTSGTSTAPGYKDTDGVQRVGDAWWNSSTVNTLPMREDALQNRPIMLNRSFYSVGELGYVFRDMPWRSLNFSSTNSADAGLLDFFSVTDGYGGSTDAPVVGGVLNLNTSHPEVLAAMLNGAARAQLYPANDVNSTDATSMANTITSLTGTLPLLNKSEIATRIAPNDPTVTTANIDSNIKERREVIVRALASAGQVRTWNLMIDVIAQTGHLPPAATGFNNFIVTAEQRYWAHVAIDRYTGQVISIQMEPVSE